MKEPAPAAADDRLLAWAAENGYYVAGVQANPDGTAGPDAQWDDFPGVMPADLPTFPDHSGRGTGHADGGRCGPPFAAGYLDRGPARPFLGPRFDTTAIGGAVVMAACILFLRSGVGAVSSPTSQPFTTPPEVWVSDEELEYVRHHPGLRGWSEAEKAYFAREAKQFERALRSLDQ
jgi:hypothetical protein